jgi:hypothetical protein
MVKTEQYTNYSHLEICYSDCHLFRMAFTAVIWKLSVKIFYLLSSCAARSRDSAVGIATSYGLDDRGIGVRVPVGSRIFTSLRSTQPPVQWVTGALSPGVKRLGREVDHSPPTSAEVKKMWIYTSTPHTPSWRSA